MSTLNAVMRGLMDKHGDPVYRAAGSLKELVAPGYINPFLLAGEFKSKATDALQGSEGVSAAAPGHRSHRSMGSAVRTLMKEHGVSLDQAVGVIFDAGVVDAALLKRDFAGALAGRTVVRADVGSNAQTLVSAVSKSPATYLNLKQRTDAASTIAANVAARQEGAESSSSKVTHHRVGHGQ